ncbi:SRPBCC domain-containing protein [Cohnella sp. CFH 77786]|uniref:SRPBCC family protein n=1 Tax=Cohnella sp. CFH 77786 TaxID=2662265 RepID=UPI001C60EBDD|nr:SRPBCC domain-containing protein [Cohnella sp. CFH 77786]MBW5447143.1 SRPBCC domain-containing protein [Cohnella sp. CFH 77786]
MSVKDDSVQEVTIIRIYDEPRELVFQAWTNPELLARWWGPDDFITPVCELDVRPGGNILIHMQGPDGIVMPVRGKYHEVVEPERLVFTTGVFFNEEGIAQVEERKTVEFIEHRNRTKLVLHVKVTKCGPAFLEALNGMEPGWDQSLTRMEKEMRKLSSSGG